MIDYKKAADKLFTNRDGIGPGKAMITALYFAAVYLLYSSDGAFLNADQKLILAIKNRCHEILTRGCEE